MSRYHITTFGCQANFSDSERIAGILESMGLKKAKNADGSDVLIFNTCSVRQTAEDRIFGLNKKLKELKTKNPELKIVLTGCITHYNKADLKKRLPYVNFFLPIRDIAGLPNLLKTEKHSDILCRNDIIKNYLSFTPKYESKFRAYVPISSGCNNFCSYCIVPYSRGREKSRPAEEIISEIKNLAENGYKEIWLLGQNVNSYNSQHLANSNQTGKVNFSTLIKMVNNIPGDFWIRFTSPHPKDFSDDLIKTIAECEKFAHYLNLPIQSGDNEILRKMKRPYTREHYIGLMDKIRKSIPDIAVSTDIIVGFPGETKKQFQDTAKLLKEIKFDMAYISEYSPRPGTLAAEKFKDNVPREEKIRRKKYLTEILAKNALANNKKLINKNLDVLIDKEKGGRFFGRTKGNKIVGIFESRRSVLSKIKVGEFAKIKISTAEPWKLKGILI
ncbi:MAG: tRNA (N6-isopentenyl adenosine(37)-C2)-methylthiotransferase MiaB [Candidatus Tagabacteria bacterium RIFCSPLOWO2_01_FULL_39_11]|uniref:tRNA-2-methylthio-N(6)-dimethylallyladenosine synthase n=1 Tax=Candidatus Tagabacteria bacterium RIFCSPLOWO2_01_FULL_39_11 TaxID=1802295 RepID=A0A1G2LND1_9BACT|nr:MAG: tRNA (N6-isopentenyl adenosine(37)-C2)-methylthiotransferase MiaB [Candidatus Tagabacteria bacterium RIFCSPLOWO2_01_FULL_39_11]